MFGIDFPELVVIGVVALVVLGPERLPKAARFVGLWVRRARAQWTSVKSELERELAAEEFRRTLHDTEKAMRDIDADVRAADADARREFDAMRKSTSAAGSAPLATTDATSGPMASPAPEPFDSLADFDPNVVEPITGSGAMPASRATERQTGEPVDAADTGTGISRDGLSASAAASAPPPPSSSFAAAAAALGRQRADEELSAAAVMTGPAPSAAALAHVARDSADDAPGVSDENAEVPLVAGADQPLPTNDHDARRARGADVAT